MGSVLNSRGSCFERCVRGVIVLDWLKRQRRLFASSRDSDVEEEMRFHIDQYRRDLVRSGVPEPEASQRAQRDFGNLAAVKEMCREEEGLLMLDELIRNVTYAFRQLRRSPGLPSPLS